MLAAASAGGAKSVQPTQASRSAAGIPGMARAGLGSPGRAGTLGRWDTRHSRDRSFFCPRNTLLEQSLFAVLSPPRELPAQKQRGSVCLHVPAPPNCSHDLNTFTHFTSSTPWEKEVIKKFAEGCAGGTKQTARIRSPITSPFANPLNHLPPLSFFNTTF